MTPPSLAKIERVSDLRAIWPNEAQHFTPWLAGNLAALGEALGLDLELQQTEAPVGGYSLDILAIDVNHRRPVIIENQLEATDHAHLGQLLTYAAGLDAGVVVWVTRAFRDEHRQALDWLNQRTDENTEFFGVVVELLRIDDSRPAPHFQVLASPSGWRKQTIMHALRNRGENSTTERGERYRRFFQSLVDTLREEHRFTNATAGSPSNWQSFSSGFSGISYNASFITGARVKVELAIDRQDPEWNRNRISRLEEYQEQIEAQLGQALDWDRVDGRRSCRIALSRPGSIDDDDDTLAGIQSWLVDNLLKLKQVFNPLLAELAK